jgi:hypothetical protein
LLDLPNTKYAIQRKEERYLIWKFKQKWKITDEVNTKWNIITIEMKFTKRKKRSWKMNIIANLIDIGKNFIKDVNFNVISNKENLFTFVKYHKLMHNNNRYYDSTDDRKLKFYSQLIERYRLQLTEHKTTYLYLTSSNMKRNKQYK